MVRSSILALLVGFLASNSVNALPNRINDHRGLKKEKKDKKDKKKG